MENVILVILLLLALALIGVVLLQRSEGGGLGIGGGGGGAMTGRAAATALTKVTWILGIAFMCASVAMTILSAQRASDASVIQDGDLLPPAVGTQDQPSAGDSLLPPVVEDADTLLPPAN